MHLYQSVAARIAVTILVIAGLSASKPLTHYSGLHLLYSNDLDWRSTPSSHLLLDTPGTYDQQKKRCHDLSETLANNSTLFESSTGLDKQLRYLAYVDPANFDTSRTRKFWISQGRAVLRTTDGELVIHHHQDRTTKHPALCSQSAPRSGANDTTADSAYSVEATHGSVTWLGTRDSHSFRFLSLPYAEQAQRFSYSAPFSQTNVTIDAQVKNLTRFCNQNGYNTPGVEDCLVASIFTPYIPSNRDRAGQNGLKPMLMWVHGGGATTGIGAIDGTFDGGNLASRGDVVVVTINYRLGTLGFLSANKDITGNYAVSDLISALKFMRKYGPSFGGDPERITIAGQSTGAQLVNALLGSPEADGLFASAIAMSGRPADAANAFQSQDTAQAAAVNVIKAVGCSPSASTSALRSCLQKVDASDFPSASSSYSKVVVDGTYIVNPLLGITKHRRSHGSHVAKVPVIYGYMREEMGSLGTVPDDSITDLKQALQVAGIDDTSIGIVTSKNNSKIFPVPDGPNGIANLSVTVETDIRSISRCGQSSTYYAAVKGDAFPELWAYTMDQRAWQISNFLGVNCMYDSVNTSAYLCHSGDLMAVFATPGYQYSFPEPRDSDDLRWMRNIQDQFASFARTGDPRPSRAWMKARGYTALSIAKGGSRAWNPVTLKHLRILSLGPDQELIPLEVNKRQCNALGKDRGYVERGE